MTKPTAKEPGILEPRRSQLVYKRELQIAMIKLYVQPIALYAVVAKKC